MATGPGAIVRAVPRKLTATTGVLLALALVSGCGGDDKKADSTAQNAATAPAPAVTATTGTTTSAKKGKGATATTGSKVSKQTDAQTPQTKTSASKTSKTTPSATKTKKATKPKAKTSTTPIPAVTPKSSAPDLTSGSGSGPIAERQDVVSVLRRYYKAFIDDDGAAVCALLTDDGQKIMISDGNGKTCAESVKKLIDNASADNIALLERTRDGLHADDITVSGNNATAQIGKTSSLKLVQQDGRWLVRSPNVVVNK